MSTPAMSATTGWTATYMPRERTQALLRAVLVRLVHQHHAMCRSASSVRELDPAQDAPLPRRDTGPSQKGAPMWWSDWWGGYGPAHWMIFFGPLMVVLFVVACVSVAYL